LFLTILMLLSIVPVLTFGDDSGNIDPFRSTVDAPSFPAPSVVTVDKDAMGAEFTLNLLGLSDSEPTGDLYLASSRYNADSFYYWYNGDWHPISGSEYGVVDLLYAEYVSPGVKKLVVKVVSASIGASQIVFGTDECVADYAQFRPWTGSHDVSHVIQNRRFLAEFTQPLPGSVSLSVMDGSRDLLLTGADANGVRSIMQGEEKYANGLDSFIIKAFVTTGLQSSGIPLSGIDVTFSITNGTGGVLLSTRGTTNASGHAEARILAYQADTFEILGKVSGVAEQIFDGVNPRTDKVKVVFTPIVSVGLANSIKAESPVDQNVYLASDGYQNIRISAYDIGGNRIDFTTEIGIPPLPPAYLFFEKPGQAIGYNGIVDPAYQSIIMMSAQLPMKPSGAMLAASDIRFAVHSSGDFDVLLPYAKMDRVGTYVTVVYLANGDSIFFTINVVDQGPSAYKIYFDGINVIPPASPYKVSGQYLAPFRVIGEGMGCTVVWDGVAQEVTMSKGAATLVMTVGQTRCSFNSVWYDTDLSMEILDGRAFIPIYIVAACFGYNIDVDDINHRINFNISPQSPAIVTIAYDANKGTGTIADATILRGRNYQTAANSFYYSSYSFNGWNTAADGAGVHYAVGDTISNVQADTTLFAQWRYSPPNTGSPSGGTGGGSGGGPATITGGDGSVALMYNLSGSVVNLFLLEDEVNKILDTSRDNLAVFDLSRLANGTGVTMPKGSLQDIITDGLALQFKMPVGSITLDAKAAKSALTQAIGDKVTLMLHNVEHAGLTAAQKAAIKPGDLVYSISLAAGAQLIRNFDGTITVSLPYDGPLPVAVWYLDSAGNLEKMLYSYNATTKMLTFNTNHLSLFVVGLESDGVTRIRLTIGTLAYTVGGVVKTMDAAPEIVDGRTMVPLRFIAEALSASVGWDGDSQTATVGLGSLALAVTIGEAAPGMDVPAMIINDRTMVPLRYISEALGCEVVWNPDTRTIDIAK
jgi:hypothetical protein